MRVFQVTGKPLATKKLASTNTAQGLPTAYMGATATDITGTGWSRAAYACFLQVETADIRCAFGTPEQDGSLGFVVKAGESLLLTGEDQIKDFKFLSKTADTPAAVHATPYLAFGK